MQPPLRVVFMGTPEFAVPSLRALAARPDVARILAVYTQPDRPAGRGQTVAKPPVKVLAEELKIPVFQPEKLNAPDEKRRLADLLPDIIVVVAYAHFLGRAILNLPRLGCINVHSSLLPKYRGAAPIQYAILNGEKETGVTTMRLVEKMDAGPILLQARVSIPADMTAKVLHDKLSEVGAKVLVETLAKLRDRSLDDIPQDETSATYAKLIKKEDGLVRWNSGGEQIINQIRAFAPWPGTYGWSTKGTIKILKATFHADASVQGTPNDKTPGETFAQAGSIWVRCSDGWIELLEIQPEGKRPMKVQEFLNGIRNVPVEFSNEEK